MALTVTNVNSLSLLNILNKNTASQSRTLEQLTTGFRINRGKDDPAGLIISTELSTELTAVDAAIQNNQRTDSMLSVADGALGEIGDLLTEIETLVAKSTNSSGISESERAANQAQIDNALTAIDRIVNTTSFNGKKLIDGTQAVQVTGVSGNSNLDNVRIYARSQSTSDSALTITRTASASTASAIFAAASGGSARTSGGNTEVVIAGTLGTATITIASGTTKAGIASLINQAKSQTGVSAIVHSTSSIQLNSNTYGSDAFVTVTVLSGGEINNNYGTGTSDSNTANDIQSSSKTAGVDASILINGQSAGVDGLDVSYNASGLSLSFTLSTAFGSGNTASPSTSFTVKAAGGATFQLGTSSDTRQTIGIDSIASYNLGGGDAGARLSALKSGGTADLRTDVATALTVVKKAASQVAEARGRVGGFQKYQVQTALSNMQTNKTGLESARSVIRDTDYAVATSQLNKETVLVQSTIQLLGVASQQAAQILSLLG